ncbi:hypothetical protein B0H16DRAFT_1748337 [Mycena metata]|uniref:Nephrocystin 3-like N-terminal domain-containing protein n=1 Tax=Mycena metata TaxID=1033252 RepID=A0AAD7E0H9_9AGAR|nr:hypothetical protein B0H16DRAFT_1748337 [Mycena metata]
MFQCLASLAPGLFKDSADDYLGSPASLTMSRRSAASSSEVSLQGIAYIRRISPLPRASSISTPKVSISKLKGAFELLARSSERLLDGTPFKIPIAILNEVIDLANTVSDNSNAIAALFYRISQRLDIVNQALIQARSEEALGRLTAFARTLTEEIQAFPMPFNRGTMERILLSREDTQTIITSIARLDACLAHFQLDVVLCLERTMDNAVQQLNGISIERWPRSKHATYGADTDPETTFLKREACTPTTRVPVLREINEWVENASTDIHPVFWLTGHAGAGKSTIAFTIARYYHKTSDLLAANFFCSRQFEDTRSANYILPSIVYQLAQHSSSFRRALVSLNESGTYPDDPEDRMRGLLLDPWQQSLRERQFPLPPLLIVLDALDEISDGGGAIFLQHLLDALAAGHLSGLRFLVISRYDPDIATLCEAFPAECVYKLQNVDTASVAEDITTFVRAKLPALKDKALVQELVRQSDGLFIYAATAVRYVKPRRKMTQSEQLALMIHFLGPGFKGNSRMQLDRLYKQILGSAFSGLEKAQFYPRLRVLHAILAIPSAQAAAAIAELDSRFTVELVEVVVAELNAVLYVKSDQRIYWYHSSFPEFIFDATRSRFSIEDAGGAMWVVSMSCSTDERLNWMERRVALEMATRSKKIAARRRGSRTSGPSKKAGKQPVDQRKDIEPAVSMPNRHSQSTSRKPNARKAPESMPNPILAASIGVPSGPKAQSALRRL